MLFVVFARHAIPGFTLRGLEAFAKAGCNVTALVNGRLSPAVLDALKPHCWRIVHRANVGQDFGAWKAQLCTLQKRSDPIY